MVVLLKTLDVAECKEIATPSCSCTRGSILSPILWFGQPSFMSVEARHLYVRTAGGTMHRPLWSKGDSEQWPRILRFRS